MIEKQEVKSVSWCDSSSQLADCLTKVDTSSAKLLHVLKGEVVLKKKERKKRRRDDTYPKRLLSY